MSKLHYLYVEDDCLSREVMQMLLEDMIGVPSFTVFEDSADFITRLETLNPQPDIILMDIQMQPLNGFEMLSLLRSHPRYREQRVIALTASVMNEEVERLRQAGFDGCIGKPVDTDVFSDLVEQIEAGHSIWKVA